MMKRTLATAAILVSATAPAFAHVDPMAHGSFLSGLTHPLTGLDHLLAMAAVGVWAAALGGKARLVVPCAFVAIMAVGFLAATNGLSVPFVEPMILASLVVFGLLIAAAVRLPVAAASAIVAGFAFFHGAAHGSEMGAATVTSFAIGFLAATAALHAAGYLLGQGALKIGAPLALRLAGFATAATGALMLAA